MSLRLLRLFEIQYTPYRDKLADHLLKVSCLQDFNRREDVVRDLPQEIQDNIERRTSLKEDVRKIVDICSRYDEGLSQLFSIINRRERESIPYKFAFAYWQEVYWKISLIELFPTYFSPDQLNELYLTCLPPHSIEPSFLQKPDPQHLVETLWDLRDTNGKRLPIVHLVHLISSRDPVLRIHIEKWLNGVYSCPEVDIDISLIEKVKQGGVNQKDVDTSLLVSVLPIDPNDEQRVSVTLYRWTAELGAKEIEGPNQPPKNLHELPDYLFEIVGQLFKLKKPQTIELIMPLTLLTHDFGSWLETEMGRFLLRRSTLLVRLWERQTQNKWANYAHDLWVKRWQLLQSRAYTLSLENVRLFDESVTRFEAVQYELEDNEITLGILFAFSLATKKHKLKLLQNSILNTGIPVAIWPHKNIMQTDSFVNLLNNCADKPLLKYVHELQRQLNPELGRNVALLWDDPSRELPAFQSFAPL